MEDYSSVCYLLRLVLTESVTVYDIFVSLHSPTTVKICPISLFRRDIPLDSFLNLRLPSQFVRLSYRPHFQCSDFVRVTQPTYSFLSTYLPTSRYRKLRQNPVLDKE